MSKRKLLLIFTSLLLLLSVTVTAVQAQSNKDDLFQRIRTVFDVAESFHKDGADLDTFVNGAIEGGLQALGDKYTNYYAPDDFQGFLDSLNGSFSGIGAYLEQDGSYVVISAPIKNTPASRAGLQSGDRILEVGGKSVVGSSVEKAVTLIRGPAGTEVTLKIERVKESRTFTVTLTRAVISIPEVEYKMLDSEVAYLQLSSFGDDAVTDFFVGVEQLKKQGAKALVLDLRQNPGGYLDAAVQIGSAFVPAGKPVVWEAGKGGKTSRTSSGLLINLPTMVLIDDGSASAAEILAGAVQDYGAGTLVGTKTFGKGTVQQILTLTIGGGMKVTIAEYLTPNQRKVDGVGLTPDVVVEKASLNEAVSKPLEVKRPLDRGMVGLDILAMQEKLEFLGYTTDADGFFGMKTDRSVERFALDSWIPVKVDAKFFQTLNAKVAEKAKTAAQEDVQLNAAWKMARQVIK